MSGATKHFYADTESLKLIENLEKGVISKICNNAIKEFGLSNIDLENVKRKLSIFYEELEVLRTKIKFLEDRKKVLIEENNINKLNKEKLKELTKIVNQQTGISGELFGKLLKLPNRPTIMTCKYLKDEYKVKASEIWEAWDLLHGVNKTPAPQTPHPKKEVKKNA